MTQPGPDGTFPILNPNTSLAFVFPQTAEALERDRYITVGCLSVMVWDLLIHLGDDLYIVRRQKVKVPVIVYIISRLATLSWLLHGTIFATSPLFADCSLAVKGYTAQYVVAVTSTCLLFALRVRAVYDRNIFITILFTILMLLVIGGALLVPLGTDAGNIGPTRFCTITRLERYIALSVVVTFLHDTSAFVAITWKIVKLHGTDTSVSTRSWVKADFLPAFSRGILHNGQIYFATVTAFNFVAMAMIFSPVMSSLKTFFTLSNLLMMNMMASRVFRKTILQSRPLNVSNLSNPISMTPLELRSTSHGHKAGGSSGGHGVPATARSHPIDLSGGGSKERRIGDEENVPDIFSGRKYVPQ